MGGVPDIKVASCAENVHLCSRTIRNSGAFAGTSFHRLTAL
jgi:hypothetical protein